jgi:hypothetical protein
MSGDNRRYHMLFYYAEMLDFEAIVGFDWDAGNLGKNSKHGVDNREAEEVFFNHPLLVTPDEAHSGEETRWRALGKTSAERKLTVIFTLRKSGTLLRVISARDMHRKEESLYGQKA